MSFMESSIENEKNQPTAQALNGQNSTFDAGLALMPKVVEAVQAAGKVLLQRFSPSAHPGNLDELLAAIQANDEAS